MAYPLLFLVATTILLVQYTTAAPVLAAGPMVLDFNTARSHEEADSLQTPLIGVAQHNGWGTNVGTDGWDAGAGVTWGVQVPLIGINMGGTAGANTGSKLW
jgi:hypothetical protein